MAFLKDIADSYQPNHELAQLRAAVESQSNEILAGEGRTIALEETIADLQIALEDIGWLNAEWQVGQLEFSRQQLADIIRFSRLSFLKNPLINRGVNIQALYVWGQGVDVRAENTEDQAALDRFWKDPRNEAELSGHQARYLKECDLQVTGGLFFVLFADTDGGVQVRSIPVEEISEIITNPEDRRDIWYFKRAWVTHSTDLTTGETKREARICYYPALGHDPDPRLAGIGDKPIKWESPVFHVKVGGLSDMAFGVPETYQALDWARAYTKFLENCATLMRKLSKYAFALEVKGGKTAVAAAKAKLGTTVTAANPIEQNPAALVGSTFVGSEGVKLDPIRTAGVGINPADGRYFRLMAAAAMGLPETFFGDADVGNHATSKTLDRPTELKFTDRQHLWKHIIQKIVGYAVLKARKSNAPVAIDSEMPRIEVNFPPILQHDVLTTVNAIVSAATLNGSPKADTIPDEELARSLMSALGMQNIDELLSKLEDQVAEHKAEQEQQMQAADDAAAKPVGAKAQPGVHQMAAALREFRAALVEEAKAMKIAA